MQIIKYPHIKRINHDSYTEFLTRADRANKWEISLSEKIDGANASVRKTPDGEILCYSRNMLLKEHKGLRGFYQYVQEHKEFFNNILDENEILYGEWLVSHRVPYPEEYYHKFYPFNLYNINTDTFRLPPEDIYTEFCPKIEQKIIKRFPTREDFENMVSDISVKENRNVEGIVAKFINKESGESYMFKYISPTYDGQNKEKKAKVISPEIQTVVNKVLDIFTEEAFKKTYLKLVDEGELSLDQLKKENIGKIIPIFSRYYIQDFFEEQPELVEKYGERLLQKIIGRIIPQYIRWAVSGIIIF